MIAALFVETGGVYFGVEGIDPWDRVRNAMRYDGPHPVVAHPPCARWCRLAGLVEARWGHVEAPPLLQRIAPTTGGHKRGEDGGLFAHALDCVRRFGGVLEHPAYSDAWVAFGLPKPPRHGGWVRGLCGGWSCHVEQGRYGHVAKKATWLYAFGTDLPALRWGESEARYVVSRTRGKTPKPEMRKSQRSRTPDEFKRVLISLAESAAARRTA